MESKLKNYLKKAISELQGLYLFASRSSGEDSPKSDWDLGLLLPCDFSILPVHKWDIQQEIAGISNADVDLAILRQASPLLQFQMVAKGERIFTSDRLACETFEMHVLSKYQRFQPKRKGIIQEIKRRGRVYD